MITDTAPFREDHYHTAGETPTHVDHVRLAQVEAGTLSAQLALAAP